MERSSPSATKDEVLKTKGDATKLMDLAGKTMLPGFVDAHGHVFMGGIQALSANMLAAARWRGEGHRVAVSRRLKDWTAANQKAVDKIQLIVGFGYDNSSSPSCATRRARTSTRSPTRCPCSSSTSPATSAR